MQTRKIIFMIMFLLLAILIIYISFIPRTKKQTKEIAISELEYFMGYNSKNWLSKYKNRLIGPSNWSSENNENYEWYVITPKSDTARITVRVSKKRILFPFENNGYSIYYNDAWFE